MQCGVSAVKVKRRKVKSVGNDSKILEVCHWRLSINNVKFRPHCFWGLSVLLLGKAFYQKVTLRYNYFVFQCASSMLNVYWCNCRVLFVLQVTI